MNIALVHDFLKEYGGAERVLEALHEMYPEAPIYTAFVDFEGLGLHAERIKKWKIIESKFGSTSLMRKFHSPLRFLAPFVWESFDFRDYDLVISSSGWYICRGIITRPETIHICYLHHPPRHLYGYETAIEWQKYWPVRIYASLVNHKLRMYDYLASQRVDYFIANSYETQKRVAKFYRRDSIIVYPPVDAVKEETGHAPSLQSIIFSPPLFKKKDYFLSVSRLARAKHVDLIIQACQKLNQPLVIVGKGKEEKYLQSLVETGHAPSLQVRIIFTGEVKDEELASIYQNAKAFITASADEEFGISAVEAMSYGVPVIAYRSGGLKETIIEGKTGVFFKQLSKESLIQAINYYNNTYYYSKKKREEMMDNCRRQALYFSKERFKKEIKEFVESVLKDKSGLAS